MKTRKEGMKQILSANLGVKRYDAKHTDRSTENSVSAIFTARCGRNHCFVSDCNRRYGCWWQSDIYLFIDDKARSY